MPEISVITTTYRSIYLEEQMQSLENQTFKDIEWIVVDDCYDCNKLSPGSYPIKHIPPNNIVPYFAKASALNDGLALAKGWLIYFMNDYVIPDQKCLERHYEVQKKLNGVMLSGRAIKVSVQPSEIKGKYDGTDYRMGTFDDGYFPWTSIGDNLFKADRRGIQSWMNGRNDSCPLEPILECNGFDESFNGAWGGEDADMANRLMTYGLNFIMDKGSLCLEFPHKSGDKQAMRTDEEQRSFQKIINLRVKNGVYKVNTDWMIMIPRDLKEERNG